MIKIIKIEGVKIEYLGGGFMLFFTIYLKIMYDSSF